jgi:hypothetical protein
MNVSRIAMAMSKKILLLVGLVLLGACVSNARRIDRLAAAHDLRRERVAGTEFEHVIYANALALSTPVPQRLYVYIDGDGRPWGDTGREPASDPTTRNPVALRLLLDTAASAVYLSRPCYQGVLSARCEPTVWTSARYSEAVVASMTTAIGNWAGARGYRELVLIGYSGGGTLAVLMGERLKSTAAVVTLAGNLDIEAWIAHHDYLPLSESLNPARSTTAHPWPELHLHGEDDAVVPPATTAAYFERYRSAQRRSLSGYGHVCCWVENWPSTFAELRAQLR